MGNASRRADRWEVYIMGRLKLDAFGISMDKASFDDLLIENLQVHFRAIPSVDELLVRPREALRYCDRIRDSLTEKGEEQALDLPDDVILRTLLNSRKRG